MSTVTITQGITTQAGTAVATVQPAGNAPLALCHASKKTYLTAMKAMQSLLDNHQEEVKQRPPLYWFSIFFSRLLEKGIALGTKIEASEETLSPELTNEISTQIDSLRALLLCCLSNRPLVDPVLDPAAQTPIKLVFEREVLLDYYAKRQKAFTAYNIPMKATDLTTLVTADLPPALPTPPLACGLIRWLSEYFPRPQLEETCPPVTLSMYTKQLKQMQEHLNTLQAADIVENNEKQREALARHEENAARFSEQSRQQEEDAARAATENLKQELRRLMDECKSHIQQVEASATNANEKLEQKTALIETLAKKMQTLEDEHIATLREQGATKETLRQAMATLSNEKQDHIKTKEQLAKEKQSLQQQNQYLQSQLTEQESRTRAAESRESALNNEIPAARANYYALVHKISYVQTHSGGSECIIL